MAAIVVCQAVAAALLQKGLPDVPELPHAPRSCAAEGCLGQEWHGCFASLDRRQHGYSVPLWLRRAVEEDTRISEDGQAECRSVRAGQDRRLGLDCAPGHK